MRLIEIVADAGHMDTLTSIAIKQGATDYWYGQEGEDGRRALRILVKPAVRQAVVDALQGVLGATENFRIVILPVEAALPREANEADADRAKNGTTGRTREELYEQIERGSRLDSNFLLMVFLSTIVACIGLVENNVAVIVGAMVIAPLLGPNISLALATSLGDKKLMWQSLKTNLTGVVLTLLMSVTIGLLWPMYLDSSEILLRTDVGLGAVLLALASGAAAVLSLTSGVSSALVGVMVAVALLPPAAVFGMLLGAGRLELALGAALLLAVNVVCVNLSAKLMFLYKGVRPRTWLEKRMAQQSRASYIMIWIVTLAILVAVIFLRQHALK